MPSNTKGFHGMRLLWLSNCGVAQSGAAWRIVMEVGFERILTIKPANVRCVLLGMQSV